APRVRSRLVLLEAVGLREAREIEPALRLMLGVRRRIEEAVDEARVGIGARIDDEALDVVRARRKTGQVEVEPPGERATSGLGKRLDAILLEASEHEAVDVVS